MRRCVVAIWAVKAAPMARSCFRVRDAAHSRSCEAARAAWMVAMAETSVELVEGAEVAQLASMTSGRVAWKPGGGYRVKRADEMGPDSTVVARAPVHVGYPGRRLAAHTLVAAAVAVALGASAEVVVAATIAMAGSGRAVRMEAAPVRVAAAR
jgi:UDP-N-acetylmuramyl pentapeptide synthase